MPGQGYGQAKAQEASMQAVPIEDADAKFLAARVQATQTAPPKSRLTQPTARPSEPVSAGLSVGPGPGPEALPGYTPPTQGDPDIMALAPWLPALELLASQPDVSTATRNFVRRMRSKLPGDHEFR